MRRLIQIQDGHPETVQVWLGFLQKYAYYGVGMKANVWEYSPLDVAEDMDKNAYKIKRAVDERFRLFGRRKDLRRTNDLEALMNDEVVKGAYGSLAPLSGSKLSG